MSQADFVEKIKSLTADLQAYEGAGPLETMAELLDLLVSVRMEQLVTAPVDVLQRRQAAIVVLRDLREAMKKGGEPPTIF